MNPIPALFRPIFGLARPIELRPLAQLIIVLAMGLLASGRVGAQGSMASCPDVAGEYQIAGFDAPLHDALEVMGLSSSAAAGYLLELQAPSGDRIGARTVAGAPSARPRSAATWTFARDFTCPHGSFAFSQLQVRATRKIDDVFYMGTSTVRMSKGGDNGLQVVVEFRGNTTIGLPFQNEMKKPGPGRTFTDVLYWPPASASDAARNIPAPTPKLELDVRRMWSKLMPDVVLGWVEIRGSAAILSFRAQNETQAAAIEERLRTASISYTMKTPPTWVGNGYFMNLELTQGVPR